MLKREGNKGENEEPWREGEEGKGKYERKTTSVEGKKEEMSGQERSKEGERKAERR